MDFTTEYAPAEPVMLGAAILRCVPLGACTGVFVPLCAGNKRASEITKMVDYWIEEKLAAYAVTF